MHYLLLGDPTFYSEHFGDLPSYPSYLKLLKDTKQYILDESSQHFRMGNIETV